MTALWWIRRDLRLEENPAIAAAMSAGDRVVPVFVFDPELLASPYFSRRRFGFLLDGLRALDSSLRERGSRLVLRQGPPEQALARLVRETKARAIYCEEDVSPYARLRDRRVSESLPLRTVWGLSYLSPREVLQKDGSPFRRFSAYARAWRRGAVSPRRPALPAPGHLDDPGVVESDDWPLPESKSEQDFPAGGPAAKRRLERFLRGPIHSYAEDRNRLDLEGTSRLSPYLRFGMISARRAVNAAFDAIESAPEERGKRGAEAWLSELIWREFYISVLYHFPEARRESLRPEGRFVAWRDDEPAFAAWCAGETGYALVDAAMRELAQTGYMHNRARMVTASFLTKHLLIDWRRGERWFMQNLIDGDPAANNGGWQWTAGTGTDAAPYFRVFNPVLQERRFDPDGRYVKRWLSELTAAQPIVSHSEGRLRALRAFRKARERARESPGLK